MSDRFDPAAHPTLTVLGEGLQTLAGVNAYHAGRDYLRRGAVTARTLAGTTAHAVVSGSTDYRVSVVFAEAARVTCTCPAHRRNRHCKHVVALCLALLEQPGEFVHVEPAPEPPPAAPSRPRKAAVPRAEKTARRAAERTAGLETVDRLLADLAESGVAGFGPEKATLLAAAGDLVRALKLRRLGNLILALQRAAEHPGELAGDPHRFAAFLTSLYLARCAAGAYLEGRVALDPSLAEDLLGKTWREEDLEPVPEIELMEVATSETQEGEFRIDTRYLADLAGGDLYAETEISPFRRKKDAAPRPRSRLIVEEAGLYPGGTPRRIRLKRTRQAPLMAADVERLIGHAPATVDELRRRLTAHLAFPFAPAALPVLFRPAALLEAGGALGALDDAGRFLTVEWPSRWEPEVRRLLPDPGGYALAGMLTLGPRPRLRCLSVVSGGLHWSRGPVYPG